MGQFNNQEEKFSVKSNKSRQLPKGVYINIMKKDTVEYIRAIKIIL